MSDTTAALDVLVRLAALAGNEQPRFALTTGAKTHTSVSDGGDNQILYTRADIERELRRHPGRMVKIVPKEFGMAVFDLDFADKETASLVIEKNTFLRDPRMQVAHYETKTPGHGHVWIRARADMQEHGWRSGEKLTFGQVEVGDFLYTQWVPVYHLDKLASPSPKCFEGTAPKSLRKCALETEKSTAGLLAKLSNATKGQRNPTMFGVVGALYYNGLDSRNARRGCADLLRTA